MKNNQKENVFGKIINSVFGSLNKKQADNNKSGFLAQTLRLSHINRWQTMACNHREDVLQHSASVAICVVLLIEFCKQSGRVVDENQMIKHALMHDAHESITGDLISTSKTANKELAAAYGMLELQAEKTMLELLPEPIRSNMAKVFHCEGIEQKLVKVCDIFSARMKCEQELASGNNEFSDAYEKLSTKIAEYRDLYPEVAAFDDMFGSTSGLTQDKLLQLIPEKK